MSADTKKTLTAQDLVCMDDQAGRVPYVIDLVYAKADHPENIFKTALYHSEAKLWLHYDLAAIVMNAAIMLNMQTGWRMVLKDGLRTIEAQARMQDTDIVKANPHWSLPGPQRLLSPAGHGGHPRGMAIDIDLIDERGKPVDMGTVFDFLTEDPARNQAARDYKDLPPSVLDNRAKLEIAMMDAARDLGVELLPLPSEWWDFRFPAAAYNEYAPLSDEDLPPNMRICKV
jgi:D-alanyl-D-alanine dipeptidase